jgi:transcriptional regulator with XRE-family HTH domain
MQTEKKMDLKKLIDRLESLPVEIDCDADLARMLNAIVNKGIVKTDTTHLFEKAIELLSSKTMRDGDLLSSVNDVAKRLILAKNILYFKGKSNYTTIDLSRFSGLSHTYVSRVEHCQMPIPTNGSLVRSLAKTLGVEPTDLFPDFKGKLPSLPPLNIRRPVIRDILDELNDLDDGVLNFLLEFIQRLKGVIHK